MHNAVKSSCSYACEHLARIAMQTCARVMLLERRGPREADFAEDFADFVRIENLCVELTALRRPGLDRDKRSREIIEELRSSIPAWMKE